VAQRDCGRLNSRTLVYMYHQRWVTTRPHEARAPIQSGGDPPRPTILPQSAFVSPLLGESAPHSRLGARRRIEMLAEGRPHWVPTLDDFAWAARDCGDDLVRDTLNSLRYSSYLR
jgi:hypothetical protein